MLSLSHTHTHTHNQADVLTCKQTGHFPCTPQKNIHQWETGTSVWTDTDYWLRGAEGPTSDRGNSWIQRRGGLLGSQLLAGEQ